MLCWFCHRVQEATFLTLEAAASHSETPMTFSGNSSAAEIHLQISLVSAVVFFFVFVSVLLNFFNLKKTGRAPISIINSQHFFFIIFFLQSGPEINTAGLERSEKQRRRRCQCSFVILPNIDV